jgi:predicted ATPase
MPKTDNNWYVVTGGPSTGKTTLLDILKSKGHKVFPEMARVVIDEGVARGLSVEQIRKDERKFQADVLKRKQELEEKHDNNLLTFFDRGMHDTLAYMRCFGLEVKKELENEINKYKYRKVFLLDTLPEFEQDYARIEDKNFRNKINKLLNEVYENSGIEVVHVPFDKPKKRADFVLEHVELSS